MFNKFKDKVAETSSKNGLENVEVEIDDSNIEEPKISIMDKMKQASSENMDKMKQAGSDNMDKMKDKVSEIDFTKAVKKFATKSVKLVEELDEELLEENSSYEINNFMISSSIGLQIGFRIDITMVKTKISKELRIMETQNAIGKCPHCSAQWKVPKTALVGKEIAKLKCAKCEKFFTINGKTFKIVE